MSNGASPVLPTTRLVLCADDFALTTGVSRGILRLLEARRLTATGAMTNRPHWITFAGELMGHADRADLGVHLNLTCAAPLTAMPTVAPAGLLPDLKTVLRLAILSSVARDEMAREITAQLDAFAQVAQRLPDFIDGHQHVHALPVIRHLVLAAVGRLAPGPKPYLRDPADRPGRIVARAICAAKALTISTLARGFGAAARRAGFPTNDGFSGVSDFAADGDFADALHRYALHPGARHLVMCHPGEIDDELPLLDPVVASRPLELRVLDNFEPARAGLELVRFRDFGEVV